MYRYAKLILLQQILAFNSLHKHAVIGKYIQSQKNYVT